jgi:hypothetical protein
MLDGLLFTVLVRGPQEPAAIAEALGPPVDRAVRAQLGVTSGTRTFSALGRSPAHDRRRHGSASTAERAPQPPVVAGSIRSNPRKSLKDHSFQATTDSSSEISSQSCRLPFDEHRLWGIRGQKVVRRSQFLVA